MSPDSFTSIHIFDIVVAIIAVIFTITGIRRGLIGEAVRLVAIFAGLLVAVKAYHRASSFFSFVSAPETTRGAFAFIALFILTVIAVLVLGWVAQKVIRLTVLGWVDRLFGAVFGLGKVLVLAWVFVMSSESSPFTATKANLRHSRVYSALADLPFKMQVPYIVLSKGRELVGEDNVRKIKSAQQEVKNLRAKVDSATTRPVAAKAKKP